MLANPTAQEPEIQTRKLLLDECVTIRTYSVQAVGDYEFYHSIAIVGRGANDKLVAKAAIENNCMLVTADRRFLKIAQSRNMPVAWFNHKNGKVYIWQEIMTLPLIETGGAPIKPVKVEIAVKPKQKASLFARIKRALSIKN